MLSDKCQKIVWCSIHCASQKKCWIYQRWNSAAKEHENHTRAGCNSTSARWSLNMIVTTIWVPCKGVALWDHTYFSKMIPFKDYYGIVGLKHQQKKHFQDKFQKKLLNNCHFSYNIQSTCQVCGTATISPSHWWNMEPPYPMTDPWDERYIYTDESTIKKSTVHSCR